MDVLHRIKGGLIVSCQALEDEPLHGPMFMAAMARSAALGGAVGIRTNGVQEVDVIKKITGLPVIGIQKVVNGHGAMTITPSFEKAQALVKAGADIVAVDVRAERPFGEPLAELLPRIRQELGVPVMADCGSFSDAQMAVGIGVDALAPTFGFQENSIGIEPNFGLIKEMLTLGVPVIAEGGFWYPEQVVKAFELGAWAVVAGTAITRPRDITRRFVKALEEHGICNG
ncbi:MAG: N-acetylmannosamine-6-phosphate 2-epimerase [Firmicutes bacterium]|nr:N-acetylmannosamine-6-phosphate 2-epimerase [Bacillota bacterium]